MILPSFSKYHENHTIFHKDMTTYVFSTIHKRRIRYNLRRRRSPDSYARPHSFDTFKPTRDLMLDIYNSFISVPIFSYVMLYHGVLIGFA
jgi:hypothetical protein